MAPTLGTDWLNSNSLRNYPLSQGNNSDSVGNPIPDSLLLDMKLFVPYLSGIYPNNFFISRMTVYPAGIIIEIGYSSATLLLNSIAVSTPIPFVEEGDIYTASIRGVVDGLYDFSQIDGVVVAGSTVSISNKQGSYAYTVGSTRLESTVVCMGPRRISGIRVLRSGSMSSLMSGQITLSSGTNHSIGVGINTNNSTLTFNALDGTGLQEDCECSNAVALNPCIRTINGTGVDSSGDYSIKGGTCVAVTSSNGEITISDTCATPSCGCSELQSVADDSLTLKTQLSILATQISNLEAQVGALTNTCLRSSIDPTSCAEESGG